MPKENGILSQVNQHLEKGTFNPFKKKSEFRFVGMHFIIKYYIINFQLFAILR